MEKAKKERKEKEKEKTERKEKAKGKVERKGKEKARKTAEDPRREMQMVSLLEEGPLQEKTT